MKCLMMVYRLGLITVNVHHNYHDSLQCTLAYHDNLFITTGCFIIRAEGCLSASRTSIKMCHSNKHSLSVDYVR